MNLRNIFLAVFIATLQASSLFAQPSREEEYRYPLAMDGTVYLNGYFGTMTVRTWDKPEVQILCSIAAGEDTEAARDMVNQTLIDISTSSAWLKIDFSRADAPQIQSIWDVVEAVAVAMLPKPQIHYLITMPRTASLRINDNKSLMDIYGVAGEVRIRTVKGSVDIAACEGKLNIETERGNVGIQDLAGSAEVETVSGTIKASILRLEGNSTFESETGAIALFLDPSASFDLDVDIGERSKFESDFPLPEASSKEFHAKVNGGGPLIEIESDRGNVSVLQY